MKGSNGHMSDNASAVDYGPLDHRLGYVLRRAQVAVFQDFFQAMGALDVSPAQYSALVVIERNPGLTQTQVADALGIKKANFVAMIKELERRGLARREAMPHDRRSFALHLTDKGEALARKLHVASDLHEAHLQEALGEQVYAALFAPMRRIAALARRDADVQSAD
jgi:DNA-binding MarR family transcriptional regulator